MKPITDNALLGAGVLVTPEGALQGSALSASGYWVGGWENKTTMHSNARLSAAWLSPGSSSKNSFLVS